MRMGEDSRGKEEDTLCLETGKLGVGVGMGKCGHICEHRSEWNRGGCGKWRQVGFGPV